MAEAQARNHGRLIEFSDEQAMLLDAATQFCRDRAPIAAVRAQLETDTGFDAQTWREIVELGWCGVGIDEAYGGSGLGLGAVVPILEPMGRALLQTPLTGSTLAALLLARAGTDTQRRHWLPRICEGEIATLATLERDGDWTLDRPGAIATRDGGMLRLSGSKAFVADAAVAALLVATVQLDGAAALILIEGPEIEGRLRRMVTIDETRRCYRLDLDGLSVPADRVLEPSQVPAALEELHLAGALLFAAEMAGGMAGSLDVTVDYLKTRKQFGRLIGAYQGLKHPTVQILLGLEAVRSHVYHAATVFDLGGEARELAVRMAKSEASEKFLFAGDRSIQFHGGFGFTYECDAHLYLRRAIFTASQYGDAAHHRRRLAELML